MKAARFAKAEKSFVSVFAVPICIATLVTAGIVAGLFWWSAHKIDETAIERQSRLVAVVVEDGIRAIARDQESITVWDDAVERTRGPVDLTWVEENLGVWMHDYFQHDGAFVLEPDGRPVYAMLGGKSVDTHEYWAFAGTVSPLAAKVREALVAGRGPAPGDKLVSPGETQLRTVQGRPAIISVKPIVPSTDRVTQAPSEARMHVALRFLDGDFVAPLEQKFQIDAPRFGWSRGTQAGVVSHEVTGPDGTRLGYILWNAYRPGLRVLSEMAPVMAVALLAIGLVIVLLLVNLRHSAEALRLSEAQAQHLALHDTLTGLPNRALFEDRLDQALAKIRRGGPAVALHYLDLDRFKQVNDTLGHHAGDELIRQVGQRLSAVLRDNDTVARLGGDEFAIIQSDVGSSASIEALCARVIAALTAPFDLGEGQAHVGVSIGIAMAPASGSRAMELTRKADIALYHAKASGRGRYVLFGEEMDETVQKRREIERDLRLAIASGDQLEVSYQPLYRATTNAVIGAEALVRWNHPKHGRMSPGMFIPIAEESGLVEGMGEWVLRSACKAALAWPSAMIAVNVSPVQLRNPLFAERVLRILRETGLPASRLELELTETALIENADSFSPMIGLLRKAGVTIALDDFGTGYSSLSHMQKLSVDRVKIDRSFVQRLGRDGNGEAIIRAIVDLAQATGLRITAEGIETWEQYEFLRKAGCDELQGYLLARPMSLQDMDRLFNVAARGDRRAA